MTLKKLLPKMSGWQWFNTISVLVIAGVLLGVVVGNQGVDGLLDRWGSLNLWWMLGAIACVVAFWVLEAVSLHSLVGCLYRGVSFRSTMRTAMIGQLFSALTPFSTGGQPVQLVYMHRDGLDTGGGASVLIVKSILYQIGLILMAVLSVITSYRFFREQVPAFGWLTAVGFTTNLLVAVGMLLLAVSPRATRKLYAIGVKILHFLRIVRDVDVAIAKAQIQIDIYHESTLRYEKKRGALVGVFVLSVFQLLSLYLTPYALYRAFGYGSGAFELKVVIHMVSAMAFVTIVSETVPLPGGSVGAEGSFLLVFALYFQQSDLLLTMLLWRLITFYFTLIAGALVMLISRKRQRAVVRLPL